MSNLGQQLHQVELSIEEAKKQISLMECLHRLKDNPDFVELIHKDFLEQEAVRAVGAKAEIGMIMNEPGMQMLENIITSVGGLRQYFIKVQQQGRQAHQAMAEDQATHAEIMQEQAAE